MSNVKEIYLDHVYRVKESGEVVAAVEFHMPAGMWKFSNGRLYWPRELDALDSKLKRPFVLNAVVLLLYTVRFITTGGYQANRWLRERRRHYLARGVDIA